MANTARTRAVERIFSARHGRDALIEDAVTALNMAVERGQEFPEACYGCAEAYGLTVAELRDAYDNQ